MKHVTMIALFLCAWICRDSCLASTTIEDKCNQCGTTTNVQCYMTCSLFSTKQCANFVTQAYNACMKDNGKRACIVYVPEALWVAGAEKCTN